MPPERDSLHRRSIRMKSRTYKEPGVYFVTVCTKEHKCLFGKVQDKEVRLNRLGIEVVKCWKAIPDHFPHAELDQFVVMPNHLHGLLRIKWDWEGEAYLSPGEKMEFRSPSKSLGSIIRGMKIGVTKWARLNTNLDAVWQRNYWEHIVRNEDRFLRFRQYIKDNPKYWRKGACPR